MKAVRCRAWSTIGMLMAGALLGCSSPDEKKEACPTPRTCDITTAGCQQLIFEATACERKQEGATAPTVRVITETQFVDEMNAALAATPPDPSEGVWNTALQMLGLLPAGEGLTEAYSDTSADSIAAYYDPDTQRVSIIDRIEASDPLDDLLTLSHEFAHALQDQDLSIDAYRSDRATSLDSFMAITALIEGEATVLGVIVIGRSQGLTPQQLNWTGALSAMSTAIFESIDTSAVPFVTALQSLPYPLGTRYLYPLWLASGQVGIDDVYAEPPLSLSDWEGRTAVGGPSVAQPLDCYPTTPPDGYSALGHEALGMNGALAMWMSTGQTAEPAWRSSASWRGDSLVVFQSTTTTDVAVAWRTRWETAAKASEVATALMPGTPGQSRHVVVSGTEVTLLVAPDAAVVTPWAAALQCGSVADLPSAPTLTSNATLRGVTRRGLASGQLLRNAVQVVPQER